MRTYIAKKNFECGWKKTLILLEKKITYGEWGHIMQKKTPLNVDEKKLWYKNGEWGRDMIKNIRLEKIRIVMVSEDIF